MGAGKRASLALAALLLLGAAPPRPQGALSLLGSGGYGDPVAFSWSLPRAVRDGTVGLFCTQPGGPQWEYIAEYPFSGTSGSASWLLENETSSAVPGHLDYSQPAECSAYAWDEKLVSQGKPPYVANSVSFRIQ